MISGKKVRLQAIGFECKLELESCEFASTLDGAQVLVAIEAIGVCHRDLIDRSGRIPFMTIPITLGHEACGRVIAVGPAVKDWKIGDRVATLHRDACGQCAACQAGETTLCGLATWALGLLADGTYATHLVAPESCLYAMSDEVPAPEAAVMHCTVGTALRGMRAANLQAGERVLITGASGGVGSAAVQVATRLGAEVIAQVRSDVHVERLRALGAKAVVVDDGRSFHKRSEGQSIDVVLECVGESCFNSSLRSLRLGGRLVLIGNIVPTRVELNLGLVIVKAIHIIGSSGANRSNMAEALALDRVSPLRPPIERLLDLASAEEAQQLVKKGGLLGRVVLQPGTTDPI